jgi:single-strand DNA-binding protein
MADNTVTLVGNLTRDPELRYTNGGQAVASFGLACNRRYQQNGEWKEQTSFFNIVAWGQLGENAAQSLSKGARIIVSGRLDQRSYETREGESKSSVEIVADEIGPSLRWATASVERTTRTDGAAGGGGGGNFSRGDQGGNYGNQGGGNQGGGGQGNYGGASSPTGGFNRGNDTTAGQPASGYGDEEPF